MEGEVSQRQVDQTEERQTGISWNIVRFSSSVHVSFFSVLDILNLPVVLLGLKIAARFLQITNSCY